MLRHKFTELCIAQVDEVLHGQGSGHRFWRRHSAVNIEADDGGCAILSSGSNRATNSLQYIRLLAKDKKQQVGQFILPSVRPQDKSIRAVLSESPGCVVHLYVLWSEPECFGLGPGDLVGLVWDGVCLPWMVPKCHLSRRLPHLSRA